MKHLRALGAERLSSLSAAILFMFAIAGCDASRPAEATPPEPGQLMIQFETSNDTEGAIRVHLEGPGIGTVTAAQEGTFVLSRPKGSTSEIIVLGVLESGPLVRFEVSDVARFEEYSASVVEVAGPDNLLRPDLSPFTVHIVR